MRPAIIERLLAPDKFSCTQTCIDMLFGTSLRFRKETGMTVEEVIDKITELGGVALWSHRITNIHGWVAVMIFGDTVAGTPHCVLDVQSLEKLIRLDPAEPPVEFGSIDGYLYIWR